MKPGATNGQTPDAIRKAGQGHTEHVAERASVQPEASEPAASERWRVRLHVRPLGSHPQTPGNPRRRSVAGQALLELAIVVPLLFLLTLIAVDVGRMFYCFQSVESAAAAGAQFGCLSAQNAANTDGIRTNALAQASDIAGLSPVVSSAISNNLLNVTVSATFVPVLAWPGLPSQVPLRRTVIMRILN
ncbi:MAG: pilus assembly protein [Verrucomicrobia bacterium]|nr:pilus assembly protein [Verrucomicrobiota bacterium]